MAPLPQEGQCQNDAVAPPAGHRIVISGMAGLFPNSHHVQDLADILYNKVSQYLWITSSSAYCSSLLDIEDHLRILENYLSIQIPSQIINRLSKFA